MNLPERLLSQFREGIQPTGLDRFIIKWFPESGAKRLEARVTMAAVGGSAWVGARRDHAALKNFNAIVQSPDDEQRWDRDTLLARATDLERNDALAGGAVAEMVLSVVGTGLSPQPEPLRRVLGWTQDQAVEWAEDVKQRFNLWAGDARECDIARKRNFYQAQVIAFRTVTSRGDVFALLPRKRHPGGIWSLKIQLIEGDRCCMPRGTTETETRTQGVEVDPATGATLRYYFCRKHPAALGLKAEDWTQVDAWDKDGQRQVLHLMHEHRLDLRRGYPLLAPVILPLKQMSRLSEAELASSVVTSLFAVAIEKGGAGGGPLGNAVKKDDKGKSFTELGGALIVDLAPGEKITPIAPTRPNGAFDPFWRSLMGQLAMRTGIPPEVLLKKYESSYTAARAALLQFWKFIVVERENLLAPDFCQPIFEAWLAEEVAAGRIHAPGFFASPLLRAAYCYCKWVGDNPPILDPLKEVMAAEEMVDYGFSTYAEQTMRLTGGDFEANHERLTREVSMRKRDGLIADLKPQISPNLDPGQPPALPDGSKPEEDARRAALLRVAEDTHEDVAALRRDLETLSHRHVNVNVQAPAPVTVPAPVVHVASPAVHVQVQAPRPGAKTVTVSRDPDGNTIAHVEED